MNEPLKIRARRGDISFSPDDINLYGTQIKGNKHYVISPMDIKEVDIGSAISPFISLDYDSAQLLIDNLWDCGLRPSEGSGSAGALKATQNHLADIKAIAFKLLKFRKEERCINSNH